MTYYGQVTVTGVTGAVTGARSISRGRRQGAAAPGGQLEEVEPGTEPTQAPPLPGHRLLLVGAAAG